jgi:hypothetical protein
MKKLLVGLLALGSMSAYSQLPTIECTVTSTVDITGKGAYFSSDFLDPNRGSENKTHIRLQRSESLEINDSVNEDEIAFDFSETDVLKKYNTSLKEVSLLGSDSDITDFIQKAISSSYISRYRGLGRVMHDRYSEENRNFGIPEIHVASYGFGSSRGRMSNKDKGVYDYSDDMNNHYNVTHTVSVDCK